MGIVGAGVVARELHGPAIQKADGATLVAAASRTRASAVELAQHLGDSGIRVHDDPQALIDDPDIDAVLVSAPPNVHRQFAEAAVAVGKHVLIEKPVAATLPDVAALATLAQQAPVVVEVVRNERFMDLHVACRQLLQDGAIGLLRAMHLFSSTTGPEMWARDASWFRDRTRSGGGAMLDLGVHKADLAAWLTDRDRLVATPAVSCPLLSRGAASVEDAGALTLVLEGSVLVTIVTSWLGPPDAYALLAYGAEGSLVTTNDGTLTLRTDAGEQTTSYAVPWSADDQSSVATIEAFARKCGEPDPTRDRWWDHGTRWILEGLDGH